MINREADRQVEAEVIRKRVGMVPRRGERAEDLSGFFSLGKIRGLENQPACLHLQNKKCDAITGMAAVEISLEIV
jgi:hypothetical protein